MRAKIGFVSVIFLAVLAVISPLGAQQPSYDAPSTDSANSAGLAPDQADPEDRNHGVARISLLNGDVSVRRGDSGDVVAAAINAPLVAQDSFITGPSSRAEVQFDSANRVRFANDTEVRFSQLQADRFQIQIARGTLIWAVVGEGSGQGEIATPSVAIHALGRGAYRVSVLPDGTTQITVRSGSLDVYTPRGSERLSAGQTMSARGNIDNPEFQIGGAVGRDEFDVFSERRDQELQQSQSYNYVSRDITGAEELDHYGQWNQDPTYGQVWTPRVAADWAPYRLGRWAYEDYYGWTWISSDPWGWAPYHYGSWFQSSYGWSWCPGPRYSHYYYRPALVAFFGFGGGGGFGFSSGWGFGNVGWVPLAPYERYNRWYGRGFEGGYRGFGRNVTIVNNTNITNIYRNARVTNGLTSINSRDFASGRFGRYASPVGSQVQQAGIVRGAMPFTPTGNHYRFNDRQTVAQGRTDFNQTRFASQFGRSSGTTQSVGRQVIQQQGLGSFGRQQQGAPIAQNRPANQDSNWQRFGSPDSRYASSGGRSAPLQSAVPQSNGSSNWQRFGAPGSPQTSGSAQNYRQFDTNQRYQQGSRQVQVAPPVVRERGFTSGSQTYSQQPAYRDYNSRGNQQGFNQQGFGRQSSGQQSSGQQSFGQQSFGQQSFGRSQPAYNSPSYNQPSYRQQPAYQQPSYRQQPAYQQPSYRQPSYQQPSYQQPRPQQSYSQPANRGYERQSAPAPRQDSGRSNSGGGQSSHFSGGGNNSGGGNRESGSHGRR